MNKTILKTIIVFAILGMAVLIAYYFIKTPAITEKKSVIETNNVIVTTDTVNLATYPVKIELMGQVIPAHETALKAQISGEIINVDSEFIPGGLLQKDEVILQIDPADYKLDIKIKNAALRQSQAALKLEQGRQEIAQKEIEIIKQSTGSKLSNSSLALRKPQLEQARADIAAAAAQLELAKLNLTRTNIIAPFNALVFKRNADIGNIVTQQETLATLVNTDEYWIDVESPIYNIKWLKTGAKAIIKLDNNRNTRTGSLLKITGSMNQDSRLANLIISVPDPLLQKSNNAQGSKMILQDYVHVTLIGQNLNDAAKIPLSYIRDNSSIWLYSYGKLVIAPVVIAYEDRKFAYITKGLANNDQIITSNIIAPVNGMAIEVAQ